MAREGWGRASLISLLLAFFLYQVASTGEQDILFLFLKDILGLQTAAYVFKLYYGFKNALAAVALFCILPLLKWSGRSEHSLCLLGLFSALAGLLSFAFRFFLI